MSKGGGGDPVIGFKYGISILMGLARGPLDELVQINAGDLPIWASGGLLAVNTTIDIDKGDIFGGDQKEGGIKGQAEVMFGDINQSTVGSDIEAEIGGRTDPADATSVFGADIPDADLGITPPVETGVSGPFPAMGGLRGVTTIFYKGLICSNSPYPKSWSFRVRRAKKGWFNDVTWYPEEAQIAMDDGSGNPIIAMNPAHILYECMTNPVWGRGLPTSAIDEPSFISAANTLCQEKFGLCLAWNRSVLLQEFMQMVINHIGAALYTDRTSGLQTLRLLRKDYNVDDLPIFDYSSGLLSIQDDTTTAPDNSHSEIIVNWINSITGKPGQTRVQNLAGTQANQTVTSTTLDYPGIPTPDLAARVALRDMQMQGAGIKGYTLILDRRGRQIAPAGLFRIHVPDRGIDDMVLRAGKVEEGPIGSRTIKIVGIQDVFGLEATTYLTPPVSSFIPPDREARPVILRVIQEANYRDVYRQASAADLAALETVSGAISVAAHAPTSLSTAYGLSTHGPGEDYSVHGVFGWAPSALIQSDIGYYDTTVKLTNPYLLNKATLPSVAWIDDELVYCTSYDTSTRTLTIGRGAVDTIPQPHDASSRIWFSQGFTGTDKREYVAGDTIDIKLLTQTNTDKLDVLSAPEETLDLVGRQGLPYPPGDFQIGGIPFANVLTQIGDLVLTWTHRDRIQEADHVLVHQDGSTGPETGVTYRVEIYDYYGALLRSTVGITGDTWTYDTSMQTADVASSIITIKLASQRDGLTSYQEYSWRFFRIAHGYGFSYGYAWGS